MQLKISLANTASTDEEMKHPIPVDKNRLMWDTNNIALCTQEQEKLATSRMSIMFIEYYAMYMCGLLPIIIHYNLNVEEMSNGLLLFSIHFKPDFVNLKSS